MLVKSDKQENKKEMSFIDHLEELRWRLVRVAIVIVVGAVVIFANTELIINNVFLTMKDTDFFTYRGLCFISKTLGIGETLCASEIRLNLQSIKMTGQFSTNIFFAIVGSVSCAFPYVFWEIWGFIKPALKAKEKKSAQGVVFFGSLLFFIGLLFGYFIISPLCVQFFGNFTMSSTITNDFTISSYLSIITTTTFFTGLFFLLPILIFILSKLDIVTPAFLKKYRRHAIVIILVLSAVITPPDFISQVIVAIPVLVLYEVGIYVSKITVRKKD